MYSLEEFKQNFDILLDNYLDQRINEFLTKTNDPFVKDFVLHSKKLVMSGGKRIRPYIAYVTYVSCGGKNTEAAMKLFISFEIFHMFALVHDDVMDKQNLRHGTETIHVYVLNKLKEQGRSGDLENVANAQAVLVGDLFFSWALEIFLDNKNFPVNNLIKAHEYFYKMVDEVCLGQILDIDTTSRNTTPPDLIMEKTNLKTARYTFVRPAQIGAYLADVDNKLDSYLEDLGTKLGIAFQLQDDLLDIVGDTRILEKSLLRDITERQHTFFTNFVLEHASSEQKNKFIKFFGKELNEEEKEEVIKIFIHTGAIKKGIELITKNLEAAKIIIKDSHLDNDYKEKTLRLIAIMEKRQKLNFLKF